MSAMLEATAVTTVELKRSAHQASTNEPAIAERLSTIPNDNATCRECPAERMDSASQALTPSQVSMLNVDSIASDTTGRSIRPRNSARMRPDEDTSDSSTSVGSFAVVQASSTRMRAETIAPTQKNERHVNPAP